MMRALADAWGDGGGRFGTYSYTLVFTDLTS